MTYFLAECLLSDADFEGCAEAASTLVSEPQDISPQSRARVHVLMAKARQGSGSLESAALEARAAIDLTNDEADVEVNVLARQALIATLADSGKLSEAWAECKGLAAVISDDVDEQLAGKAYWVIGNVAFLSDNPDEGLRYHELAATTFSPARNLGVWAKFNKASAAMRLAANVADADTLRCIERAELATDVIGGSANDYLLLRLNRAHWSYLAGDPHAAVELLLDFSGLEEDVSPQRSGEACLILGRALLATGERTEARDYLRKAADHFDASGAHHRAQQTRDFLKAELGRASFWSWLVRVTGFDRS